MADVSAWTSGGALGTQLYARAHLAALATAGRDLPCKEAVTNRGRCAINRRAF